MFRLFVFSACLVLSGLSLRADQSENDPSAPKPVSVTGIRNVHVAGNVMLAGQPTEEALAELAKDGYTTVITLRHAEEERFDEQSVCEMLGMKFVRLPINAPDELNGELIQTVCRLLKDAKPDAKVLCHCAGANRVGAVWIPFRVEQCELNVETAKEEAAKVGLKTKVLEERALKYLQENGKRETKRPDR